jgi:hypothetical protein
LLRAFLKPEEAEIASGDLLEAYRDSIHPVRGSTRANFWYVQQVAGYILRTGEVKLRNCVLAGLTLCVLTTVFSALRYPSLLVGLHPVRFLVWIVVGLLVYGSAAIRWTHPATPEDASILRLGTRWGIANGAVWITSAIGFNLVTPHEPETGGIFWLLALAGSALQLVPGIHGALKTRKVLAGLRAGFWSGIVSGLMVFFVIVAFGYVLALVPGRPGAEFPKKAHIYAPAAGRAISSTEMAAESEMLDVSDALGGAFFVLFGFCPLFGGIGGRFFGWTGIMLARTGGPPDEPAK